MKQIPLPISLPERAIFDNYVVGNNQLLVSSLQNIFTPGVEEQQILLWSKNSYGKSHLLSSVCHLSAEKNKQVAYVPLRDFGSSDPSIFEGMENLDAVCIDDLDLVVSDREWATQIFNLINVCRDRGTPLIMSASEHPREFELSFEDLRSRLLWGAVYHLKRLSDQDLLASLFSRARSKGLEFPVDAADYLLSHFQRNTADLLEFVDVLDQESLSQKRRITIPLIKQVMQQR